MSRIPAIFSPHDPCSPLSIPASQTALLLLDYQNLTVSRCGAAGDATVLAAAYMKEWALKQGFLVVHCVVDAGVEAPSQLKAAGRLRGLREMVKGEPGLADVDERLWGEGREEMLVKRVGGKVSALESDGLKEIMRVGGRREGGVKSLVLGGLSTSGCVLSTAKAVADAGFVTTVLKDMCMDPVEGLHDMLVEHVLTSNSHVCTTEEFQKQWGTVEGVDS